MKNHFEWKGTGGKNTNRDAGFITIGEDKDGLPILYINVDDDFYSGVVDHQTLFRLMTELAEAGIERKRKELLREGECIECHRVDGIHALGCTNS